MAVIFMVEDNESIREAVEIYLKLADYEVESFSDLAGIKKAMESRQPDLIILDVMLPDGDGFNFAKELRRSSQVSLVFMSARESESDRITGFEVGADDYIVKPFSPKELALRVGAVLKRAQQPSLHTKIKTWKLNKHILITNEDSHKATLDSISLNLTATEWKILLFLCLHANTVVTREEILDRCLDYSFEGYDRTVDTHIKNLRAKLKQPGWIETVRGYGYRFAGKSM